SELAERARHALQDTAPIAAPVLAKDPHGRIPRTVRALQHPAPFALKAIQEPNRTAERPGKMHDSGIDGDDEIELLDERSRVEQATALIHPIVYRESGAGLAERFTALLQADECDAFDLEQRRKLFQ